MSVVFGVNDLLNLKWLGDEQMDEFIYMWRWIHTNVPLGPRLPDDTRRDIFIVQIEKSVVLKEDIAHYHRTKNSDHKNTVLISKFLEECVDRHLQPAHERKPSHMGNTQSRGRSTRSLLVTLPQGASAIKRRALDAPLNESASWSLWTIFS
jgi:hypothetical protein